MLGDVRQLSRYPKIVKSLDSSTIFISGQSRSFPRKVLPRISVAVRFPLYTLFGCV